ncbi:MAG: hypothetical protein AB7O28_02635 [Vicinamibacterales bacterium]
MADGSRRRPASAGAAGALVLAAALSLPVGAAQPDAVRALCAPVDQAPAALARRAAALDDAGRSAAAALAASAAPADALCGVSVLAAVRDPRVGPLLVAAVQSPALREDAFRLVRWAAFVAGGPDPAAGRAVLPLVAVLESPALRAAVGDDAVRLLGEIDADEARARLLAELERPASEASADAAIHGLARQREARARQRVHALGRAVASTLSTNPVYEESRRMAAVAFYELALGADAAADGLAMLGYLPASDQADAGAWAVQTLCEQGVRHPDRRAALDAERAALIAALDARGLAWRPLARGMFPCPSP